MKKAPVTIESPVFKNLSDAEESALGLEVKSLRYHLALQRVRREVWNMERAEDIDRVVFALRACLEEQKVPFSYCSLNVVENEEAGISMLTHSMEKEGGWRIIRGRGGWLIDHFWRGGQVVYRRDLQQEDPHGELGHIRVPLRSIVDAPFSHGTLAVSSTEPEAFGERDIDLLVELAGVLSEGFRRQEDLRRIARLERRYRTLVETPDQVVMLMDLQGRYLYVSPQIALCGYAPEDFYASKELGQRVTHPEDFARTEAAFRQAAETGEKQVVEFRWTHREGQQVGWGRTELFPVFDENGQVESLQAVIKDISERKRAEEALKKRERTAILGAQVGRALAQQKELRAMLQECAQAVVEHLDTAFARIWTLDEAAQMLQLEASAGLYTHIDGDHSQVPVGRLKIGLIAQEKKPHMSNRVMGDARVNDQEWARREGMVAFAGYPLLVGERLVGVLATFARHPLGKVDLQALASIADGIAMGIDRKHKVAELARLASFPEDNPDPIVEIDAQSRVTYANPVARQRFPELSDQGGEHPLVAGAAGIASAAQSGRASQVREIRVGEAVYEQKLSRDPASGRVRLYSHEITARKQWEEALQQAKEAADTSNRAKSQFLAVMSHELRTPLNAIIGFGQMLADQLCGPLGEKQLKYVGNILGSGQHLLGLINEILDLSRIEIGKVDLELKSLDVRQTLEELGDIAGGLATSQGVELECRVEEGLPPLLADEGKLKQIVFNLVSNAIKFTPAGGKVRVEASRWQEVGKEHLQVLVCDTGIGIAAADQERIFKPFEQVDSSHTRRFQGTGLGLALARALVGLHGGRIWVHSEGEGRGSTFGFSLPLERSLRADSPAKSGPVK